MYATAIGAGVSQLWNLLRGDADSASSSSGSATPASTTGATASGKTTGTGSSGGLSADLNTLLLDLQSGGATSSASASAATGTDPTSTVAGDLQSVFSDLSKAVGGGRGHHHHHGGSAPGGANGGTPDATGSTPQAPTFQNLASSLLAYTRAQGGSTGATSLTA